MVVSKPRLRRRRVGRGPNRLGIRSSRSSVCRHYGCVGGECRIDHSKIMWLKLSLPEWTFTARRTFEGNCVRMSGCFVSSNAQRSRQAVKSCPARMTDGNPQRHAWHGEVRPPEPLLAMPEISMIRTFNNVHLDLQPGRESFAAFRRD